MQQVLKVLFTLFYSQHKALQENMCYTALMQLQRELDLKERMLEGECFHLDRGMVIFTVRTIDCWNNLPREITGGDN